jgi:hypothetical protein
MSETGAPPVLWVSDGAVYARHLRGGEAGAVTPGETMTPPTRTAPFLIVISILGAGCGSSASSGQAGGSAGGGGTGTPGAAPVGTPKGNPVTGRIGPNGGSLASGDGALTLTVPPGAVAAETTFSIQPVTNTAFGGLGDALRLDASGASLAQPLTLTWRAPAGGSRTRAPAATGSGWSRFATPWRMR